MLESILKLKNVEVLSKSDQSKLVGGDPITEIDKCCKLCTPTGSGGWNCPGGCSASSCGCSSSGCIG